MIGIVGAGAFGTALAVALAHGERSVRLWGRGLSSEMRQTPRLPGVALPRSVAPTSELEDLRDCGTLLLAVPMQQLGLVVAGFPLHPDHLVAACKGMDLATLRGPTKIIAEALPDTTPALLSGPGFAADIARGLPTALSLGCADEAVGRMLQALLSTPILRLYRTTDVMGMELGGALKNVIAIACGAAIGAGLGESARAALMTRGMAEMLRLAPALGARTETLMGLSGMGDLALTCASPQSRNFALGHALGARTVPADATTEGAATAQAVLRLAARHDIDLPITRQVAGLVSGQSSVEDAMARLLDRDLTAE